MGILSRSEFLPLQPVKGTSISDRRRSPFSLKRGGQPAALKPHLACKQFSCNICAETSAFHQQRAALEQTIHHW